MKINRLTIKGLFDLFDYDLDFTNEENLKIITGPNGFGKTMILNILYSLFNRQFSFFHKLVFEQIEVFFENDFKLEITKEEAPEEMKLNQSQISQTNNFVPPDFRATQQINTKKTNSKEVIAKYYKKDNFNTYQGVFSIPFRLKSQDEASLFFTQNSQQILPHIIFVGNGKWLDKRIGSELTFEEMILGNLSLIPEDYISVTKPILADVNTDKSFQLTASTQILELTIHSKVYLIKEQRLVKEEIRPPSFGFMKDPELLLVPSIEKYRNELKTLIGNSQKEHSKITNNLDGSFPKILLDRVEFGKKFEIIKASKQSYKNTNYLRKSKRLLAPTRLAKTN